MMYNSNVEDHAKFRKQLESMEVGAYFIDINGYRWKLFNKNAAVSEFKKIMHTEELIAFGPFKGVSKNKIAGKRYAHLKRIINGLNVEEFDLEELRYLLLAAIDIIDTLENEE